MPKFEWSMNPNTIITVLSFLITMGAGAMAYSEFKATMEADMSALKTQRAVDMETVKAQRASDISRLDTRINGMEAAQSATQTSVNLLNIQDARQTEQLTNMLLYLQRIEKTLDKLVEDRTP